MATVPHIISTKPQPTTHGAAKAKPGPVTGRDAWAGTVPIGWCRMRPEDDPDLVLLVELGNTFPAITDGFGGWEVIDVPGKTGITHWRTRDPIQIPLELFFNDDDLTNSVEDAIATLEAFAGRGSKRHGDEPAVLKVDTGGLMPFDWHQFPDTRWVINGIDYSTDPDEVIVNSHGNRVRQTATVTLLEYIADARLASLSADVFLQRRVTKKRYRVKQGDTLITIAAKQLGDASRWDDIARLNNLRDPRSVRQGALIRLP